MFFVITVRYEEVRLLLLLLDMSEEVELHDRGVSPLPF